MSPTRNFGDRSPCPGRHSLGAPSVGSQVVPTVADVGPRKFPRVDMTLGGLSTLVSGGWLSYQTSDSQTRGHGSLMVWLQRLIPGLWCWKILQVLTRKYPPSPKLAWRAPHTARLGQGGGELTWEDTQEPVSQESASTSCSGA